MQAMHAIAQVKPIGPELLDLNVPEPPSLDRHMELLEFPVKDIPDETAAARIRQKQELRQNKIEPNVQAMVKGFFTNNQEATRDEVV